MRSKIALFGFASVVALGASACVVHAHDAPSETWTTSARTPAPRTTPPPATPATTTTAPPANGPASRSRADVYRRDASAHIVVSEEIRQRCALPSTREEQPRFDAGSAEIKLQAGGILERLATCLATGPLEDRRVRIEGHTDPRGGEDYNRELGQKRADSTKTFFAQRGVANERMNAVSLGLSESKGKDEASWALDRRVEIELVPENVMIRRR